MKKKLMTKKELKKNFNHLNQKLILKFMMKKILQLKILIHLI
jgi:hypothetical protein